MTFEEIAKELGAEGVDWAIDRLRRYAPLVGYHSKGYDDSLDQLALEGALNLQKWLHVHANACDRLGEDAPECVELVDFWLPQVLPLIARNINQPNRRGGGQIPDDRRQICADVCVAIWREHNSSGPYSERLWGACEAYWQACDQPETSGAGNLKQWQRFCATASTQLA